MKILLLTAVGFFFGALTMACTGNIVESGLITRTAVAPGATTFQDGGVKCYLYYTHGISCVRTDK